MVRKNDALTLGNLFVDKQYKLGATKPENPKLKDGKASDSEDLSETDEEVLQEYQYHPDIRPSTTKAKTRGGAELWGKPERQSQILSKNRSGGFFDFSGIQPTPKPSKIPRRGNSKSQHF